ncbi:oxidoreductase [Streptomyces sp. Ru73]|uniref:FMN reductase n=1 Tax=Streptomyces sp. Ru73 TaxID=2080748 RepID=UPI000CDD166A|nr:FMN reductase [Streptomyces sp. Ru73]POX41442.1 oxidoreductase [Streptomyces sp. Ru73]
MKPLTIVAVSAGLGVPSSTRLLADRLAEAARQRAADGTARPVEVRVIELRGLATDIAHNMVTGFPSPALAEAIEAVTEADGVIAVTPIFTASYSGLFKSFFDVVDNTALTGKPVLIAATGGTPRHSLALEHALRPLFAYLRAVVVPTAVYAASEDWGTGGSGPGGALTERIERAAAELTALLPIGPASAPATSGADASPADASPADGPDGSDALDDVDGLDDVVPFEEQLAALRAN